MRQDKQAKEGIIGKRYLVIDKLLESYGNVLRCRELDDEGNRTGLDVIIKIV